MARAVTLGRHDWVGLETACSEGAKRLEEVRIGRACSIGLGWLGVGRPEPTSNTGCAELTKRTTQPNLKFTKPRDYQ